MYEVVRYARPRSKQALFDTTNPKKEGIRRVFAVQDFQRSIEGFTQTFHIRAAEKLYQMFKCWFSLC